MYQCSSCRESFSSAGEPSRCPNCGISFYGKQTVKNLLPTREEERAREEFKKKRKNFFAIVAVIVLSAAAIIGIAGKVTKSMNERKLCSAVENGNIDEVNLLLDRGVNVNARTQPPDDDRTALMIAAQAGHAEMVALLLRRGAARDAADKKGNTALTLAIRNGHTDVVKLLMTDSAQLQSKAPTRESQLQETATNEAKPPTILKPLQVPADLQSIVKIYSSKIQDEHIFFQPNIPPKKVNNAKGYASTSEDEEVLALIDDTVFGSAKEGLLLTNKSLYAHNLGQSPRSFPLQSIKLVEFKDGILNNGIDINGAEFYVGTTPQNQSLVLFSEMLAAITSGGDNPVGTTADVKSIVKTYAAKLKDGYGYIFLQPNIPPEKVQNARRSYAHLTDDEEVLALIDGTVFGSAEKGVILTSRSIYASSPTGTSLNLRLEAIKLVEFKEGWMTDSIRVNGTELCVSNKQHRDAVVLFSEMLTAITSGMKSANTTSQPIR